jgi:hypothetical protein
MRNWSEGIEGVLKQGPGTELCLSKLIILLLNAVGEGS